MKRRGRTMYSGMSRARCCSPSPTWMFWISVAAQTMRWLLGSSEARRPRPLEWRRGSLTVARVRVGAAARLHAHQLQLDRLDGHRALVHADLRSPQSTFYHFKSLLDKRSVRIAYYTRSPCRRRRRPAVDLPAPFTQSLTIPQNLGQIITRLFCASHIKKTKLGYTKS